jgi:hypothetical protein
MPKYLYGQLKYVIRRCFHLFPTPCSRQDTTGRISCHYQLFRPRPAARPGLPKVPNFTTFRSQHLHCYWTTWRRAPFFRKSQSCEKDRQDMLLRCWRFVEPSPEHIWKLLSNRLWRESKHRCIVLLTFPTATITCISWHFKNSCHIRI